MCMQVAQPMGQEGKTTTEGVDVTGISAMDGTEDKGETKPMED